MRIQKSFKNENATLYIIPTPIGNLDDFTIRAYNIMKNDLDILLCEDTRVTRKILSRYEINVTMRSYHDFNKEGITQQYIDDMLEGKTYGLVSDAGMPGISDPGYDIINKAIANDINVVVLPGASALLVALVGSNLPNSKFTYHGFLTGSSGKRNQQITDIFSRFETGIIYESPHKLIATLKVMQQVDSSRIITLARELTKLNEEYITASVDELVDYFEEVSPRGEYVIVVSPATKQENFDSISIEEHVNLLINSGENKKDAIKKVAKLRGLKKNDVYQIFVGE
jgi:16S rRNA (cytidine1402-2'-O)-methyltransferase